MVLLPKSKDTLSIAGVVFWDYVVILISYDRNFKAKNSSGGSSVFYNDKMFKPPRW